MASQGCLGYARASLFNEWTGTPWNGLRALPPSNRELSPVGRTTLTSPSSSSSATLHRIPACSAAEGRLATKFGSRLPGTARVASHRCPLGPEPDGADRVPQAGARAVAAVIRASADSDHGGVAQRLFAPRSLLRRLQADLRRGTLGDTRPELSRYVAGLSCGPGSCGSWPAVPR